MAGGEGSDKEGLSKLREFHRARRIHLPFILPVVVPGVGYGHIEGLAGDGWGLKALRFYVEFV